MMLIILRIVLVICLIGSVISLFIKDGDFSLPTKKKVRTSGVGILLSLIVFVATFCIAIIPANQVGIKYNAFSGVSEETLSEGWKIKTPFDKIYTISTEVQERTIENISVQTHDSQWVTVEINVKYQVDPTNAYKVFKNYKTLDNLHTNLISNLAQRAIEEVTTKYNVIELLGESRNDIYTEIEAILKTKLSDEGVSFKFLTIKDTEASEAIEKAIEDEAIAKKAVDTAEQNKQKAEIEAATKLIQAQGEADANAVKTEQLTEEILMEMLINKWNGELPKVSGSNSNMFDLSSLLSGE